MKLEITEKQFSHAIEDLLDICHWRWTHFRPARTVYGWRTALSGHPGFTDYVAVRPPRLLLLEAKSEKGRVSPAQEAWLHDLSLVETVDVHMWKPSQFEQIKEVLR